MKTQKSQSQPVNASVKTFRAVADRYVEETFERFPTYGSAVGRKEFNGELETPSTKLYAAHIQHVRKTLEQVQSLPESDFVKDDWLDRRALMAELRTELWSMERKTQCRNPEMWASGALNSIYSLILFNKPLDIA